VHFNSPFITYFPRCYRQLWSVAPPFPLFYNHSIWSVVMISVVDSQRKILISPTGTNVWSGQVVQSLNSDAVTWALAKDLYSFKGPYWIIPLSLVLGIVPTTIQWLLHKVKGGSYFPNWGCHWLIICLKRWPKIGPVTVSSVILPLIYMVRIFLPSLCSFIYYIS